MGSVTSSMITFAVFAGSVSFACAEQVDAAVFEWTNAVSGLFFDQNKWSLVSGAGVPPPEQGDTVLFNEVGVYTITFNSGGVTRSDVVNITDCFVTFRRSSPTIGASYNMTTGDADLVVSHGNLDIGTDSFPINMTVGDHTWIEGGAFVDVQHTSALWTENLRIASNIVNTGLGKLTIDGFESTLNVTGTAPVQIGQYGFGTLEFIDFAGGTIDSTINLGTFTFFAHGSGTLNVLDGSQIETSSINVGGGSDTSGLVTVEGIPSELAMVGDASLVVGGPSGAVDGHVMIHNFGVLITGTGLTHVRPTGIIDVSTDNMLGALTVNGDILIDGGQINILSSGLLNLPTACHIEIKNGGDLQLIDEYIFNDDVVIDVTDGGRLYMATGGYIGFFSDATVNVSGGGSEFEVFAPLRLGSNGSTGQVTLSDGAIGDFSPPLQLGLDATENSTAFMKIETGADATANVVNVIATGPNTESTLFITDSGSSLTTGPFFVGSDGAQGVSDVIVAEGGLLHTVDNDFEITNTVNHSGTVTISNGTILSGEDWLITNGGRLHLSGGLMTMQGGAVLTNGVGGTISGTGGIGLSNSDGTLQNEGTISPGDSAGSLAVSGSIASAPSSLYEFEIGGFTPNTEHDQLFVTDSISLDGTIQLSLINGFIPDSEDTFTIIQGSPVVDAFATEQLPPGFDVQYFSDRVEIFAACPGDIVGSLNVDVFDLLDVLEGFGTPDGDVTGDGATDVFDLLLLLASWGGCL